MDSYELFSNCNLFFNIPSAASDFILHHKASGEEIESESVYTFFVNGFSKILCDLTVS